MKVKLETTVYHCKIAFKYDCLKQNFNWDTPDISV